VRLDCAGSSFGRVTSPNPNLVPCLPCPPVDVSVTSPGFQDSIDVALRLIAGGSEFVGASTRRLGDVACFCFVRSMVLP